MPDILGLTFEALRAAAAAPPADVPRLRAEYRRVLGAAGNGYSAGVPSAETALHADVAPIVRRVHDGGTIKFVQRLPSGLETESVIIPMQRNRRCWKSMCVSSQVGCARGCTFCETAQLGLLSQLTAAQIVGQVVAARRELHQPVRNIVFMGMGEPLDNLDNVIQAIRVLTDPDGLSYARERITVSTVGRIDGIRRLAALGWRRLNLAVSLNAPNDGIRAQIMPITRSDPMDELRRALLDYPLRNCQFIMLEYVLIPGLNDCREHAQELAEYARPIRSCVNIIPYNPIVASPWPAPSEQSVQQFVEWVRAAGQPCKRRVTRGRSMMAACGQLGNRTLGRPAAIRLTSSLTSSAAPAARLA
jgi:23S rRNA (adenine2503-C2)-methyltransferase